MTLDPIAAAGPAPVPACAGQTELMYDPKKETEAKQLCQRCPLRIRCLARALERREPAGVWGGLNEAERRAIELARPDEIPMLLRKFAQPRSSGRRAS